MKDGIAMATAQLVKVNDLAAAADCSPSDILLDLKREEARHDEIDYALVRERPWLQVGSCELCGELYLVDTRVNNPPEECEVCEHPRIHWQ